MNLLKRYEATRAFTDREAWLLFRAAAIGEAVGWTLLAAAIIIRTHWPVVGENAVAVAGRLHGMLFVLYLAAVLALYPSLRWSRLRGLVALAASTPPLGSLLFEQWESHRRNSHGFRSYRQYGYYLHLIRN